MSRKNLSFKNLKVKKIISVIMSMTMSLNCVVAHAGPKEYKKGEKNHNKNQRSQNQQTNVPPANHQEEIQQKIKEKTTHYGENEEILAHFIIPGENNKNSIIYYNNAETPNKDENSCAVPATIKIIDGKSEGFFFDETNPNYLNPTNKSEYFNSLIEMYKTIKTNDELKDFCINNKTSTDEISKNFVIMSTNNNGGISLIPFPSIDENIDLTGIIVQIGNCFQFVTYIETQDNNLLPFLLIKEKDSLKLSPLCTKKAIPSQEENLLIPQNDNPYKNLFTENDDFFITKKEILENENPISIDLKNIEKDIFNLQKKMTVSKFIKKSTIGYLSSCENRRNQYSHLFHPGIKEYKSLEERYREILNFSEDNFDDNLNTLKTLENRLKTSTHKVKLNENFQKMFDKTPEEQSSTFKKKELYDKFKILQRYCNNWNKYFKKNILEAPLDKIKKMIKAMMMRYVSEDLEIINSSRDDLVAALHEDIPLKMFSDYLYKENLLEIKQKNLRKIERENFLRISREKSKTSQLTQKEIDVFLNTSQNANRGNNKKQLNFSKPDIINKTQKEEKQNQSVEETTLINFEEQPAATTEIKSEEKETVTNPLVETENKQKQKTNPSNPLITIPIKPIIETVSTTNLESDKKYKENETYLINKMNNTFLTIFEPNSIKYFDSKKSVRGNLFTFSYDNKNEKFLSDCFKNNVVKWKITQEMWQHMLGGGEKNTLQMDERINYHIFGDDFKENHSSHEKELAQIFPNNFKKIIQYIKGANFLNSFIYSIENREDIKNSKLGYSVALLTPILKEKIYYFLCTVWRKSPRNNTCYIVTAYPMFCIEKEYIDCNKEVNNIFKNFEKAQLNKYNICYQAPA
ncbi:MAG: hypothetical protein LBT82_00690 [Oscillospiraceae bacterium]|jgi:hypothetical protein|nr:hypothetical protein [Oscillospiraceae bacterium]